MHLGAIAIALIDRPGQTMREAAKRPRGWWLPALLLVIGLATYAVVTADAQVSLANERSAQFIERLTEAMSEQQAQMVRSRRVPRSAHIPVLGDRGRTGGDALVDSAGHSSFRRHAVGGRLISFWPAAHGAWKFHADHRRFGLPSVRH